MTTTDSEQANAYPMHSREEFEAGVQREWYLNKRVVAYRLVIVTQATIDIWARLVIQTLEEWPKDRPYLALHDLAAPGVALIYASLTNFDMINLGITAEKRLQAEQFFDDYPGFRARVAVNFNLSFSGRMGKILTSTLVDNHPAVTYKMFYNRDKAFAWLDAGAAEQHAP